ncbi:hypothetical protein C0992_006366 [Termitomyces sp. T32_za158]|nr:hypothetical protein C0992_006366 [Termitomyces sp. T32_za158]
MFRLMRLENLESLPKPCEYFDMIGGAGTGGVIALMLGRLRMPIDLAIEQYVLFCQKVFSDVKKSSLAEKFKATPFEDGMRDILQSAKFPPDVLMQEDDPVCRRTYKVSDDQGYNCTVVQAARATTAAPDLFKPVSIGFFGVSESFAGAGLGYSNPTNLTLEEAEMVFGLSQPVACLMAVDDWNKKGEIQTHTLAYLEEAKNASQLNILLNILCICPHKTTFKALRGGTTAINSSNKKTSSEQEKFLPIVPAPSPLFVGREDILSDLEKYFDPHVSSFKMQVQRHYVLHGPGGAGKTQIAQKFCSQFGSSSKASIEQSLTLLTQSVKMTDDTPAAALIWLCYQKKEWLMIFDNTDDPDMNLHEFFPDCSHGNILITSRNEESKIYAPENHQKIAEMTLEDSLAVFYKTSRRAKNEQEAAMELVKELSLLPLAIIQAGNYLFHNQYIEVKQYLERYKKDMPRYLAEIRKQKIDKYQLSVFATWDLSYQKLDEKAKAILMLCSVLHNSKIPMSILERAWKSLITTHEIDTQELQDFLKIFSTNKKDWSDTLLEEAVDMLRFYSLVEIQGKDVMLLEIHSLVHSWAYESLSEDQQRKAKKCAQQLFYCLGDEDLNYNNAAQWVLHLHALMNHLNYKCENYKLAQRLQRIFSIAHLWSDTEQLQQQVLRECKEELGSIHPDTIQAMYNLAETFWKEEKLEEAEKLEQEVLKVRREAFGTDHPDTIQAMSNLAATFWKSGKLEEAEKLEQEVLKMREKASEANHPNTIQAIFGLASILWKGGKRKEAEKLQQKVPKIRREAFEANHPNTFKAMSSQALTFWKGGKLKEAEKLQQEVLNIRRQAFETEHPNTIEAMSDLALTFKKGGKLEEAENFEQEVLKIRREAFEADHPDTIQAMSNLATTFQKGEKLEKAEGEVLTTKPLPAEENPWKISTFCITPDHAQLHAEDIIPHIHQTLTHAGYTGTFSLHSGFDINTIGLPEPKQDIYIVLNEEISDELHISLRELASPFEGVVITPNSWLQNSAERGLESDDSEKSETEQTKLGHPALAVSGLKGKDQMVYKSSGSYDSSGNDSNNGLEGQGRSGNESTGSAGGSGNDNEGSGGSGGSNRGGQGGNGYTSKNDGNGDDNGDEDGSRDPQDGNEGGDGGGSDPEGGRSDNNASQNIVKIHSVSSVTSNDGNEFSTVVCGLNN